MKHTAILIILLGILSPCFPQNAPPVKIAVVGLSHDHVHGILGRKDRGDVEVVGIYEPNTALANRLARRYQIDPERLFTDLDTLLDRVQPEAVTAFNPIFGHLEVVRKCAPRGIHVMVEKPLAVNMDHAREMATLAQKHNIHLLTNYETTWYGTHYRIKSWVEEGKLGPLRKMVVHDGHEGPKEIGVSEDFLSWLTDPVLNGGGAVIDFGCYGANLATWLMEGERPLSVTAVLQTHKPEIYPRVDDEATLVLTYPQGQAILQASWNWPFGRKDIEVYGQTGYAIAQNRHRIRVRTRDDPGEKTLNLPDPEAPMDDPFAYLAAVLRGKVQVKPMDLSSLENNLIVVEILDAAIESARTKKTVQLK